MGIPPPENELKYAMSTVKVTWNAAQKQNAMSTVEPATGNAAARKRD